MKHIATNKLTGHRTIEDDYGNILTDVHPVNACVGQHCTIDRPSEHPLKHAKQLWRSDRRIFERICSHGVGHPDVDGRYGGTVHGCDGCCTGGKRAGEGRIAETKHAKSLTTSEQQQQSENEKDSPKPSDYPTEYDANDPFWDGTDAAHPAWWRGNDAGVKAVVKIINGALDGKYPAKEYFGYDGLTEVVERLKSQLAQVRSHGCGKELDPTVNRNSHYLLWYRCYNCFTHHQIKFGFGVPGPDQQKMMCPNCKVVDVQYKARNNGTD